MTRLDPKIFKQIAQSIYEIHKELDIAKQDYLELHKIIKYKVINQFGYFAQNGDKVVIA